MKRPLFDANKKVQSTEYYRLMTSIRSEVNKARKNISLDKLSKTQFFRFVKVVYSNDWNKLLVDVQHQKVENVMTQFGLDKFQSTVKRKRTKLQNQHVAISNGFVYVASNPAWPNWTKIGSAVSLEERLATYQTGDPTRSYTVVWSCFVNDRKKTEKELRELLQNNNVEISHEWCKISAENFVKLTRNCAWTNNLE